VKPRRYTRLSDDAVAVIANNGTTAGWLGAQHLAREVLDWRKGDKREDLLLAIGEAAWELEEIRRGAQIVYGMHGENAQQVHQAAWEEVQKAEAQYRKALDRLTEWMAP
jgi:hypothetical protein